MENKHKWGIGIAVFILLISHIHAISAVIAPEPIQAPLCEITNTRIDSRMITSLNGIIQVPDYHGKIFVKPLTEKVSVGSPVALEIEVEGFRLTKQGETDLKKPYFYVLVFNPDKRLQYIFPCFYDLSGELPIEGYSCSNDAVGSCSFTGLEDNPPFKQWTNTKYPQSSDPCKEEGFNLNGTCLPRTAFISSAYDGAPIHYSFFPDKPGVWEAYVILFDEDYENQLGTKVEQNYRSHAVAMGLTNIHAASEKVAKISMRDVIITIIIVFFALLGYLLTAFALYDYLEPKYIRHRRMIHFIIGISIALFIVSVFLCRWVLPVSVC